ncbi:MAG: acyl-CoA synthetase [Acidimicrobiia bacterium]
MSRVVPEPEAKALLAARGVPVPRGVIVVRGDARSSAATAGLRAPLVVKAFGAAIVHKTDVGAVQLGVDHDSIEGAISAMDDALRARGLRADGFLVEEQAAAGVELLVGATRGPYGIAVTVGLGGTLAEVLDDVAVRLAPLDRVDAEELLDGFRAARVLRGARGGAPVDRDALVAVLLAIAGRGGLVDDLGDRFDELDCNPVIARSDGAIAVDVRLVERSAAPASTTGPGLAPARSAASGEPPPLDFAALFSPRSVAVAGVSTTRPGFGNRAVAAYRAFGWTDGLAVIHPSAVRVDGVRAYPSVAAVEGGVDYLLAAVPAEACADLIRGAAGQARVVHVISGGFSEAGERGASHERALLAAARATGVRIVGPNCIGVYAPAGRQTFQLDVPTEPGVVGVVSQSGGLAGDIVKVGAARGLRFSKVVSVGNCVDVTPAEIVEHLVSDDETRVVGCYLEGARDGERLVRALRAARGRVPVVVMTGGLSEQGGAAAVSHTGALTGDRRVWDAIQAATGVAVVERLEDFLGALVLAQRYGDQRVPATSDVLVMGVGGGASVLATDACDRAGLAVTAVEGPGIERLRALGYGAGTSVVNPVEIGVGPAAPADVLVTALDAVLGGQPYPDVLAHVNVQAYYGYGTGGTAPLCALIESLGAALNGLRYPASRVVLVTRNLDVAPGADVDAVLAASTAAGVPVFRTFDEAAAAIAALKAFTTTRSDIREEEGR